jgi:hypothetical protein
MAERIVSPGVFTQERDLSFLPQGVAQIGAAFIGPFVKGPAFIPTTTEGLDAFITTFGEPGPTSYAGYAVNNYLREAGSATVVRVLGWTDVGADQGYATTVGNIYVSGSDGSFLFATIHPNIGIAGIQTISATEITSASFGLTVGSGSVTLSVTASTDSTSADFISNIFGTTAAAGSVPGYVYAVFPQAVEQAGAGPITFSANTQSLAMEKNYSNASTPWIQSQPIGGEIYDLFKLHTLGDGVIANTDFKISITGIAPSNNPDSDYGQFTILIRSTDDIDNSLNVLEEWSNLSLDPTSQNYIARRIGNSVPTEDAVYEGDFPNRSSYIRVEMKEDTIPANAVPYGFGELTTIVPTGTSSPALPTYVTTRWVNDVDKRFFYGYDYSKAGNLSYLAPTNSEAELANTSFNIDNLGNEVNNTLPITLTDPTHISYRRFTIPLQGGFDGFSPARRISLGAEISATNTQGFNLSGQTTPGTKAYKRALTTVSNPDNIDINMLVLPGVLHEVHGAITEATINVCESRQDCFYIMDIARLGASISDVTGLSTQLDTNYAAAYYPWVRVLDDRTNTLMWAPPSTVLPEVYAYNDSVGAEWFAPAGLNRGGVPGAVGVKVRLNQSDRDVLYESKVNPIAQFPGQGISVWGQKTLQRRASALDRVNVRRLLITVKKFIASSARYLVFEQNTEATRNRFLNIANPYLAGIQQRSGLTAFRVIMDETNNGADIIDRNILQGAIYLQPTRTAEFIKLDFNILPTGASFDTI